MKTLTIVVPTYNMETYLEKCLSSLVVPGMDRLEVLVINDGSRDASPEIARRFEAAYPMTFRAIDKENGHYGSCVNRGLQEATGKYFKVLDADDSFDPEGLEGFLAFLDGQDADLILSDFVMVSLLHDGQEYIAYPVPERVEFDFAGYVSRHIPYMWMHGVAHKTEKLRRIGYRQLEGIPYTDKELVFYPMAASRSVSYFPQVVYRYVTGREGQSVDEAVWVRNYGQEQQAIMRLVRLYETHARELPAEGREFMLQQLRQYLFNVYQAYLKKYRGRLDLRQLEAFDRELKEVSAELYELADGLTEKPRFYFVRCWRSHPGASLQSYLTRRYLHRVRYYIGKTLFGKKSHQ